MIISLLYLLSFLLIWQFVGYPTLMATITYLSKPHEKDYMYKSFVSILVATYNEESVIASRLNNLLDLNYPKELYEILVVNSGSKDRTSSIVENFINNSNSSWPRVRLIEEKERGGKASAIQLGKEYSKGEIILIADANSIYERDVLKKLVPYFKDPLVGAVSGKYIVSNSDRDIPASEAFYWDIESIMFSGESRLDSISTVIGTISAWRKDLINFGKKTLTEDLDMTIQVRSQGYKVKYEPEAIVYEPSAITAEDQIKQRKRICIGTIQNFFLHIRFFLFHPNLFTSLIFPSHKMLTMLSPFVFLSIFFLYLLCWDFKVIILHILLTTTVFSLMFVFLMRLKAKIMRTRKTGPDFSISAIPKIIYYVLLNEYLILLAWLDFVSNNYSVLWERAESTRQDVLTNKEG